MQFILRSVISCCLTAWFSADLSAQSIAEIKFADYLPNRHLPQSTIDGTLESLGDDPDKTIKEDFPVPMAQRVFILGSFLEKFKNNITAVKKNKALLNRYTPEEQKMMQSFQTGAANLDEEGQLASFTLQMEDRPSAGSGKLSWNKISTPLSTIGQNYYQQVIKIEKALNWPVFFKEACERDRFRQLFVKDEVMEAINKQLETDRAKVPMKKVKVFEGMDATTEMQDPAKMTKLLQNADNKRQKHLQRKHAMLYLWWKANEDNMRKCADEMDSLLEATNYGNNLAGHDRQLIPVIADVQERLWEVILNLNSITHTMVANAQMAAASRKLTEDAAEMYKKIEGN